MGLTDIIILLTNNYYYCKYGCVASKYISLSSVNYKERYSREATNLYL